VVYEVPQQRSRPGVVTTAGYLLFLVAFLLVVDAIVAIATAGTIADATRKAYESAGLPTAGQTGTITQGSTIFGGVIYILLAAGFAVLGVLDLRGKNPARIVTWVLAGLGVLCFCLGTVGGAAGGSVLNSLPKSGNGVSAADLAKQIQDGYPSWLVPTQTTLAVVNLIALILVIILLALPASNPYFRTPTMPEPGYPSLPQQYGIQPPPPPPGSEPPYPGQPPYSGPPSA
jgi:hypothetical protein